MRASIRIRPAQRGECHVVTVHPPGSEFQKEQLCSALNSESEIGVDPFPYLPFGSCGPIPAR
jgi:hypothetical protein